MVYDLHSLVRGVQLRGNIAADVPLFLRHHDCPKTAEHVAEVAAEAHRVALRFDADANKAEIAGWLHDVSAVIPNAHRIEAAESYGIDVLPEERAFPMIVHQRLSVVLARDIFGVTDEAILSAIGCHTTLKADASLLDKVVFIADKIAWDQPGTPPYLDSVNAALNASLDAGVMAYLQYLWDMRDQLRVVHPWLREAYLQMQDGSSG